MNADKRPRTLRHSNTVLSGHEGTWTDKRCIIAKDGVEGSNPFSRSRSKPRRMAAWQHTVLRIRKRPPDRLSVGYDDRAEPR